MGEKILLALDANEEWEQNSKIRKFATELGLLDVGKKMHTNLPPTRPSSGKTIDYILGTEEIGNACLKFGMAPYNMDILGDHRGCFLDLDVKRLLNHTQWDEDNQQRRKLHSTD